MNNHRVTRLICFILGHDWECKVQWICGKSEKNLYKCKRCPKRYFEVK